MRVRLLVFVVASCFLTVFHSAGQDQIIITNGLTQITEELGKDDGSLFYMPDGLGWDVWAIGYWQPMWIDFSEYPSLQELKSIATLSANPRVVGQSQYGVQPLHVMVTLDLLSGDLVLSPGCSTEELARASAPSGYQPGKWPADCRVVERLWQDWQKFQSDPDWQEWYGSNARPFLTFHFQLADLINEKPIYDETLAAEEAASLEAQAKAPEEQSAAPKSGGGGMMLMDSESCAITDETQPFIILSIISETNGWATITWESCSDHMYEALTSNELSTQTVWTIRATMIGDDGSTSWSDTNAPAFDHRFYRARRLTFTGDEDGDELNNLTEFLAGSSLHSTNVVDSDSDGLSDEFEKYVSSGNTTNVDALADADGDGYSNWDEALMITDPKGTNDPFTVYVDCTNTNGVYDGTQAHPFRSIQDAIESSVPVNSNLAIRVRPGAYYEPVSNLQYDPYYAYVLSSRQYLYIYAANNDWTLSTDPESHIIDSLGFQHRDLLLTNVPPTSAVEFYDVARARINGFSIRGGQGYSFPYFASTGANAYFGAGVSGFSSQGGPIHISNCIVEKNGSFGLAEAGGIFLQAATNSLIYNTVITKNTGQVGGILDINGTRIWNSTIVSNVQTGTGVGGVWGYSAPSNVRNSIVRDNGLDLYSVNVDYSAVGSNLFVTAGAHNLTNDPILVNVAFSNYRLQTNSPAFNAGTALPVESRDLYGNSRPVAALFDIGANEFKDTDGDGMQDDWETKHSLNPNSAADKTGNPDGDGFNNLAEYNHNTDPQKSDTDSDGIADHLDPEPTKPDLILDTVFWDYFFENVFLMYFDGVPDPRWVNNPPLAPRPVVLTDRHIGDHIFIQWQVVSFGFDSPFLVFYVPHTTRGSIIPDVNAVPLNQIQFGFGDVAPPDGPWGFTIAQTTPTNNEICTGFDDVTVHPSISPNPWLSVSNGKTNIFTLMINPTNIASQIVFKPALGKVNVIAVSTNPGAYLVGVISLSTNTIPEVDQLYIEGVGAQNTFTAITSVVNLLLLPPTNATIAIHKIIDPNAGSTPPTNVPSAPELATYLESVFGSQANVHFTVLSLTTNSLTYDFDSNHKLDVIATDLITLSAEQAAITNFVYTPNALNVYFVSALTNLSGDQLDGVFYKSGVVFIQDDHLGTSVNVAAHEIGHFTGLENVLSTAPDARDRLMYISTPENPNPCRLIYLEWITANKMIPLQ